MQLHKQFRLIFFFIKVIYIYIFLYIIYIISLLRRSPIKVNPRKLCLCLTIGLYRFKGRKEEPIKLSHTLSKCYGVYICWYCIACSSCFYHANCFIIFIVINTVITIYNREFLELLIYLFFLL